MKKCDKLMDFKYNFNGLTNSRHIFDNPNYNASGKLRDKVSIITCDEIIG